MFQKMSERTRRVLAVAQYEADLYGRPKIGTEHILMALMMETNGTASAILQQFGAQEEAVRQAIIDHVGPMNYDGSLVVTPNTEQAMKLALREAIKSQGKKPLIDTSGLLLGIVLQPNCSAVRVLKAVQIDVDSLAAVARYAASGLEGEVATLMQAGQIDAALKLLGREVEAADATAVMVRNLRDRMVSMAARGAA